MGTCGKEAFYKHKQKGFVLPHIILRKDKFTNFKFYDIVEKHMFLCRHLAMVLWKFKIEFSLLVLLTKGIIQKVCVTCCFLHGSGIGSTVYVMA